MPIVVLIITLSNSISIEGSMQITVIILIIAPLDMSVQSCEIISTLEYTPTPNVEAKKPSALTMIDFIEVLSAIVTASCLSLPALRSVLYLVVIRIA